MKPKRIVFVPVIAVIAGLSAFLAVLLICLDLIASDEAISQKDKAASERSDFYQSQSHREAAAQRGLGEPSGSPPARKREGAAADARPDPAKDGDAVARSGDRQGPPEDVQRRIAEARMKIESLHREGRHEAAEEAERDLREWMADRGGPRQEGGAAAAGSKPAEAEGAERGAGEAASRRHAEHREKQVQNRERSGHHPAAGEPGERIRHLAEAAEHLQLAGFHEEAEGLRQRIKEMEERMRQQQSAAAGRAGGEPVAALMHRVEELQAAMGRMREDMHRLSEQLAERRKSEQ